MKQETVWIKNLPKISYLVTSRNFIYDLEFDEYNLKQLVRKRSNRIDFCSYNTLMINDKIYCFKKSSYFYFVKLVNLNKANRMKKIDQFLIEDIFRTKTKSSIWKTDQTELRFIFEYHSNQLIFMTQSKIFIFQYKYFSVDDQNRLHYNLTETYQIRDNKLIDQLKELSLNPIATSRLPRSKVNFKFILF